MMKKITLLFSLIFLLICHSCIDTESCRNGKGQYEFEIPVSLSPALDSFRIGDTIHIVSSFSDRVYDRASQDSFLLDDFLFYPYCNISKIDTVDCNTDGLKYFDFIDTDNVFFTVSPNSANAQYIYQNGRYMLRYQIVPKRKGLYALGHVSDVMAELKFGDQKFEGKCPRVESNVNVNMNNGSDNNIDFLLEASCPRFLITAQSLQNRFFNYGGYCFYVVE